MLRDIRSSFLKPRLIALKYTTASSAVTINEGVGSAAITSAATGSGVITISRAFARRPICVANASSANIAAGGFVAGTANLYPTSSTHTLKTVDSSATADDGTCHAVFLGYDYRDSLRYSRRTNVVRGELDLTRVLAFRVNTAGSGSVTINARNVSVLTRNGTGDITLSFRKAFAHTGVVAIATAVLDTGQIVMIGSTSSNSITLKSFTNGGTTAADAIINCIVIGDDQGGGQGPTERVAATPAMTDQRKPVLFGYSTIYAAGVPGYDLNSGDATLADTATGRTTFTFREKFAREAIVCAMPIANTGVQCCTIDTSSATGFEVKQFDSSNNLADCTNTSGFQLIGIGFDDSTEY